MDAFDQFPNNNSSSISGSRSSVIALVIDPDSSTRNLFSKKRIQDRSLSPAGSITEEGLTKKIKSEQDGSLSPAGSITEEGLTKKIKSEQFTVNDGVVSQV